MLGATIEHMAHDLPTIWSRVSNGLLSYISIIHPFILSGRIHAYHRDEYVKDKSTRLTWYHKNPHSWKRLIQPTMDLKVEMADLE